MSYFQGNLALDKKQPAEVERPKRKQQTGQQQIQQQKVERQPAPRVSTLPTGVKLIRLAAVMFAVCVLVFIMWRYTQIYQVNLDISKAKGQINEMQAENSSLKQQIETLQSPERLKKMAIELGFKPPIDGQVSQVESKKTEEVDPNQEIASVR